MSSELNANQQLSLKTVARTIYAYIQKLVETALEKEQKRAKHIVIYIKYKLYQFRFHFRFTQYISVCPVKRVCIDVCCTHAASLTQCVFAFALRFFNSHIERVRGSEKAEASACLCLPVNTFGSMCHLAGENTLLFHPIQTSSFGKNKTQIFLFEYICI